MKTIVLLSGGVDSTTALYWAQREHDLVGALAFQYGSNHAAQELACARYQAKKLGVAYHEVDIRSISQHLESALLSGAEAIPKGTYDEANMKQTVVPFRNGIFLSVAAGIAESKGAEAVAIAAHAGDHSLYPDCREEYMQAMGQAIELGTYAKVKILRPFISMSKGEIVRQGALLGVDFAHTYSCYCGGAMHCGRCGTCRERQEAFRSAGITDPTHYQL